MCFSCFYKEHRYGILGHLLVFDIEHVWESSENKGYIPLIKGIWGVEKMLELLLVPAAGLTVASENRSEK